MTSARGHAWLCGSHSRFPEIIAVSLCLFVLLAFSGYHYASKSKFSSRDLYRASLVLRQHEVFPMAYNTTTVVLQRPKFLLFGDSLTERSNSLGGWGASLAHHFYRKVGHAIMPHVLNPAPCSSKPCPIPCEMQVQSSQIKRRHSVIREAVRPLSEQTSVLLCLHASSQHCRRGVAEAFHIYYCCPPANAVTHCNWPGLSQTMHQACKPARCIGYFLSSLICMAGSMHQGRMSCRWSPADAQS